MKYYQEETWHRDKLFGFRENSILVMLPFNVIGADVADKAVYKVVEKTFERDTGKTVTGITK